MVAAHQSSPRALRLLATPPTTALDTPLRLLATLLAIALLLASDVAAAKPARFEVETNTIQIKEPASIAGTYEAGIGDFGVPKYGGTLLGRVLYPKDDDPLACKSSLAPLPQGGDMPIIMLVDRGDCYFTQKAWHAQQAGAAAVVVTDHTQEPLLTMAVPESDQAAARLVERISIPVVLVTKDTGERIKAALASGGGDGGGGPGVVLQLDWKEAIIHPDNRVEWEFWFSTNDGCGQQCDSQKAFIKQFKEAAMSLERENHTQFTPHVLSRRCYSFLSPERCNRECIHRGQYCAWDSVAQQFEDKYHGRQVVEENKRHICVFQHLNNTHQPWLWWDFAARFAEYCTMASGRFDGGCAEEQMRGVGGIDVGAVNACMGDLDRDTRDDLLQAELAEQRDEGGTGRGRVIMLPTVVVNTNQYRGRLDPPSVLRALCAGFSEGTEPPMCMAGGLNVDECSAGKDNCWRGPGGESACVDTFRGYVCNCPAGWQGDGHQCEDIDECALHIDGCDQICVNEIGGYHCECRRGYKLQGGKWGPGICLPSAFSGKGGVPWWALLLLVLGSVGIVAAGGVFTYRWRLRREMHSEIRSIMRQYMPLGEDAELGRTLLSPRGGRSGRGGGGGESLLPDEDFDKHTLAPSGAPERSAPSITELAQTASPRNLPSL